MAEALLTMITESQEKMVLTLTRGREREDRSGGEGWLSPEGALGNSLTQLSPPSKPMWHQTVANYKYTITKKQQITTVQTIPEQLTFLDADVADNVLQIENKTTLWFTVWPTQLKEYKCALTRRSFQL